MPNFTRIPINITNNAPLPFPPFPTPRSRETGTSLTPVSASPDPTPTIDMDDVSDASYSSGDDELGEASSPRKVNSVGKLPEAGVIVKVYVENFMCHRKLSVQLCRNVNFIHGQNGSGKVRVV